MKAWITAALLAGATLAHAQGASAPASTPAKKQLVAKVLELQRPGIESMAAQIAQAPVLQMLQEARMVLVTRVPPDKRESIARAIEADAKKYVDEATPLVRERAVAAAPSTVGAVLEDKFTEDELRKLVAWLESPVNKKYQQVQPEMSSSLGQKLAAELAPVFDPKLNALRQKMQASFTASAASAASAAKPASK